MVMLKEDLKPLADTIRNNPKLSVTELHRLVFTDYSRRTFLLYLNELSNLKIINIYKKRFEINKVEYDLFFREEFIKDDRIVLTDLQKTLLTTLNSNGALNRKDLVRILCKPRTTIYDNLKVLMKNNIVNRYSIKINETGRPLVFFKLRNDRIFDTEKIPIITKRIQVT